MESKPTNNPKKSFLYYYCVTLALVFLFNLILLPMMNEAQVKEVSYSQFKTMVEAGQVTAVKLDQPDGLIGFTAGRGQSAVAYKTGYVQDTELLPMLDSQKIPYGAEIPRKPSLLLNILLSYGLPILIFFGLGQVFMRTMAKRGKGMGLGLPFGSGDVKVYEPAKDRKTFADVAGADEAKDSLLEVVDYLQKPAKYADIGAECPKGILLVGPPGTGKTLLAKAVAGEASVPFFSIAGSEFVEMFVGRGAAKVRDLFEEAKKKAPCIVFIDEIDTIGKRRDGAGFSSNDEREQTLNQLLTEMDGFQGNKGVILLAATNRPEVLDPALLRPGRFDRQIPVELPDLLGRTAILKVHAKDYRMAADIDYQLIARATAGASGAQLENVVNEAALRAVRMSRSEVTQEDLEESVETVIAGARKKNAILSPDEKRVVAFHEIGHALVAARQSGTAPVQKITIVPRTSGALGYTLQVEEADKNLTSRNDALSTIATICGGRAAEELVFGDFTTGAANDIEKATKLARAMVTRFGMTDRFDMMALETGGERYLGGDGQLVCSPATARRVDDEVLSIIRTAHEKARAILEENREQLDRLAERLLEKESITGEEFMALLADDAPTNQH